MIDGIKIEVTPDCIANILNSNLLDFKTLVSTTTGEIVNGTQVAKRNGLTFILTPTHNNRYYCIIRGSLHKYHNNGLHNADNFTYKDLVTVLLDLQNDFGVCLTSAYIRNIEIGVNILSPIQPRKVLRNVVACGGRSFAPLRVEGATVGKQIERNEYRIKIYDKSKQYNLIKDNILRVEVAIKKMRYLQQYGIKTLSDLLNIEKVQRLGGVLLKHWDNIIYYDKAIKWRGLTDFQQKKILYYATPRNWGDFTKKQRYRAKKHFTELMQQYNVLSHHPEISKLIGTQWAELVAEKCPPFHPDLKNICSRKMSTFSPLEYTAKKWTRNVKKRKVKINKKSMEKNRRKCRVCGADISHKRTHSVYCSKRCNNSYHATQRKKKRHKIKNREVADLNRLLRYKHPNKWALLITYGKGKNTYTDQLDYKEVYAPLEWVRQVQRVKIETNAQNITLTSYRARRLIKEISNRNKLNCKNGYSKNTTKANVEKATKHPLPL